jgi:hypothetical protein
MVRPACLVFNPGGFALTIASPEDIRQLKLKTRDLPLRIITTTCHAVIIHVLPTISFFSVL